MPGAAKTWKFSTTGTPEAVKTAITAATDVPQKVRVAMQNLADLCEMTGGATMTISSSNASDPEMQLVINASWLPTL